MELQKEVRMWQRPGSHEYHPYNQNMDNTRNSNQHQMSDQHTGVQLINQQSRIPNQANPPFMTPLAPPQYSQIPTEQSRINPGHIQAPMYHNSRIQAIPVNSQSSHHYPGYRSTGNGLVSILHGCKDVMTSTLHIVKGRRKCCNVTGNYNDGDLIGYGVFIAAYGLFVDFADDVHRFRWLRIFRIIAVPFYYMFLKSIREINVDITYEFLDGILHHSKEDNIDCQDFEDYTKDKQREKNDQFDLLDYTPCSRFDLIKHFYNLVNLTKEHLDSVNFITHNKVTSFNLEVTEDNNPSEQEQNLRYNIDGEIYSIKTPNLFVKLHPRCYNVYSSYTGPLRWS
ncbi:Hypothetical predicted protein [Mytilus galloprovincialis]|uniref:Uncharacterized protein n=1 Tax=Mytilus galloprovincialis TaxID=29158 RepID=A0A8B6D616_MYTGA|nr:Hypothetical predicted protein [Mytilus galloprovincialis]